MRNKTTKKNMDLDLRRYGNKLYSKAEQSGGGGSSDDGGGGGEVKFLDEMTPEECAKTYIFKDDSENAAYPDLFLGYVDYNNEDAPVISATTMEEYFDKFQDAYYEYYGFEIKHEELYNFSYSPKLGYSSIPEGQQTVFSAYGEPIFGNFRIKQVSTDTGQAYIIQLKAE